MATFKIKNSKNDDQSVITVKQDDSVDLSAVSAIVASVYTDDLSTTVNTYNFSGQDLTDFKTNGEVEISSLNLLGSATPDDDFYSVSLNADTGDFISGLAGVGITLEAKGETYNKQGFVNVYDPDYRIPQVLHTAHMLVLEMDNIENEDYSLQKRVDFTTRLATLQKILSYS